MPQPIDECSWWLLATLPHAHEGSDKALRTRSTLERLTLSANLLDEIANTHLNQNPNPFREGN